MQTSTRGFRPFLMAAASACGPVSSPAESGDSGDATTQVSSGEDTESSGVSASSDRDATSVADSGGGEDAPKLDIAAPDAGDECDGACMLDAQLCAVVQGLEGTIVGCGPVGVDDDASAWAAAHDCAVRAMGADVGVVVTWQEWALEGLVEVAIIGSSPATSSGTRLVDDGAAIWATSCGAVTEEPDCVADVGQMCLVCDRPGATTLICQVPCKGCPPG
jgi:hypothetical protein